MNEKGNPEVGNDDVQISAFMKKLVGAPTASAAANPAAPHPGTGSAEPAPHIVVDTPTLSGGGNGTNAGNAQGGGSGGGWWASQSKGNQIFALIMLALVVSFGLHAWNDIWNMRSAKVDAEVSSVTAKADIEKAKAEAEVARLKAEAASYQVKRSATANLPVINVSTFDCTTHEKMNQGFASASTFDGPEGSLLMIGSGCTKVRFNHKITSLRGSGYVVTFDPVNSSNPVACGNGASGKDDAPSTCIDFINRNIGESLNVLVNNNNSLKLGG